MCSFCPCFSYSRTCVLSALAYPIVRLLCSFCLCYSLCKFTGTFSATVLLIMYSLGWCSLCPCLSLCESTGTFSAIAYHSVNLVGPVFPSLSQCLPFCTFLYHLTLSVLDLSDVGGTVRPPLRFLIIVGFWWALSPLPYHSKVLVSPFSASL